jgi:hypothetical protein
MEELISPEPVPLTASPATSSGSDSEVARLSRQR